jgi:hypothetical protein
LHFFCIPLSSPFMLSPGPALPARVSKHDRDRDLDLDRDPDLDLDLDLDPDPDRDRDPDLDLDPALESFSRSC